MRAVTFQGIEHVETHDVAEPVLRGDGDAIVRVEYSAICGSDLHVYHGRETGLDAGTILGHEFVGTVVEPGSSGLAEGLRVAAPFRHSCAASAMPPDAPCTRQ